MTTPWVRVFVKPDKPSGSVVEEVVQEVIRERSCC